MWHITLPGLKPVIVLMTILALGNILNAGFDQIYNIYNQAVYSTGDIIDTWVYRVGLNDLQFSLATAVGLLKSVIGFLMICALSMGGEAPHLGMVVTEGSLAAYSVRRNLLRQSNDRGCFYLHPEGMELEAGEEKVIRWVIFPHEGKEDFLKKAGEYNPHFVDVRADRYVLFPGEKSVLTIHPAFRAEQVSVNGEALTGEDGIYTYTFTAAEPGEKVFEIAADQVHTRCRLFVQEEIHSLTEKRCHFIPASNEPSSHACMDIWRLPRGSNTPLLAALQI